jgi:hypothetical protein
MTEQELREELEAEYIQKLEEAYGHFENEMQQSIQGAMQAMDDYKAQTENKLQEYRRLSNKLYILREQKRQADIQHAEAVESIMREMYDLEHKSFGEGFTSAPMGCSVSQKCCAKKKKSSKVFGSYDGPYEKMAQAVSSFHPPKPNSWGDECCDEAPAKVYTAPSNYQGCLPKQAKYKNVRFLAEDNGPWGDQSEASMTKDASAPAWGNSESSLPDDDCTDMKISDK